MLTVLFANFKYGTSFIILFCCLFFSMEIFGQNEIKSLPVQFGQYMRSAPLINPAIAGSFARIEVNTGVQRQGGNWSNISTYYLNANFRLTRDRGLKATAPKTEDTETENTEEQEDSISLEEEETSALPPPDTTPDPFPNNFHVAGLSLIGDKEGAFLNRTGIYGLYSWHTRVGKYTFLSAGAAIGVKNYSVDENYVNGGGSSYAPDGNVGLFLYSPRYSIGVAVNQIFNGKLKPIREVSRLVPHVNITGSRTWQINRYFALKPSVLVRIAPDYNPDINLYISTLLQNIVSATAGYKYQRGMTCIVGLEKIRIGDSYFKAAFSYYFPVGNNGQLNINTYEITLNYFLKPNRNVHDIVFQ